MNKKEKQNRVDLTKRLWIAFGVVTIISIIIALVSLSTIYYLYLKNQVSQQFLWMFLSIMLFLIVISIVASSLVCRKVITSIIRPLNILIKIARLIAEGDASSNVNVLTKDEIGQLMQAFKDMIENIRNQSSIAERIANGDLTAEVKANSDKDVINIALNNIVININSILTDISSVSEQVANGAAQISDVSFKLSEGATQQASSIEQLTASIESVQSQIDFNVDNANKAKDFSNSVKNDAIKGNYQMEEMLRAINEINVSSSSISNIIKVIDDISFQTNILALNAAVEAARAGQYGKGFSVVAEEVRNLAARSAVAAKETTELIENSIKSVEHGTKIAKDTADSLSEIVKGVEKVVLLVSEIADSSSDQANNIGQINVGINQVLEVVQVNSAASEESAAAIEELYSQAETLKEMIRKFKLNKSSVENVI
jgi:methyl-accepting chemotaxis protein